MTHPVSVIFDKLPPGPRVVSGIDLARDEEDVIAALNAVEKAFDPNQPRDDHGRWSDTGAGGAEPDVLAPITGYVTQSSGDWEQMRAKLRPGYDISARYPSAVRYRGKVYMAQLHAIAQDMAIRANRKGPEPKDYDAAAAQFERDANKVGAEHLYGLISNQGNFRSFADLDNPDAAQKAFKSFNPSQPRDQEGKWTDGTGAPRLTLSRPKGNADAFFSAVDREWPANPLNGRQNVMMDQAAGGVALVELQRNNDGSVHISWLQAHPGGKGMGTKAMTRLTQLADEYKVKLDLLLWEGGGRKSDLKRFYQRFGFTPEKGQRDTMVRVPKAVS